MKYITNKMPTPKKEKEKDTINLAPKDYIVFNGGLKIENVSVDNNIELELPEKYTVTPMVYIKK